MLSRLACKFKIHRWHYETQGHFYDGFMYPVRYRTCKICSEKQIEIIDKINTGVIWKIIRSDNTLIVSNA